MSSTLQKQVHGQMLAMVQTTQHHLAVMEQAERQAGYALETVTAFSLYIGARYSKSLLLLEALLPDQETLTPEARAHIEDRLDELERNLDRIEQRTAEKIINLIE